METRDCYLRAPGASAQRDLSMLLSGSRGSGAFAQGAPWLLSRGTEGKCTGVPEAAVLGDQELLIRGLGASPKGALACYPGVTRECPGYPVAVTQTYHWAAT
jgi:hypothetical protein